MKLKFLCDFVSSQGTIRRAGDIRDYPDGMADLLVRRGKAEPYREPLTTYRPKKQKAADE